MGNEIFGALFSIKVPFLVISDATLMEQHTSGTRNRPLLNLKNRDREKLICKKIYNLKKQL